MDRRMLIAGNWKMYTTSGEGAMLVQDLAERVREDVGRRGGRRLSAVHRPQGRLDA